MIAAIVALHQCLGADQLDAGADRLSVCVVCIAHSRVPDLASVLGATIHRIRDLLCAFGVRPLFLRWRHH